MNKRFPITILSLGIVMLAFATGARSQQQPNRSSPEKTQKPVFGLIRLPVQDNSNFGVNPGYRTQDV
jgi:hypothetical protein